MTDPNASRLGNADLLQAQLDRVHEARGLALLLADALVDAHSEGFDIDALVARLGAALADEKRERGAFAAMASEHHRRQLLEQLAEEEKRRQHEVQTAARLSRR